ncbi:MAG: PIN domain-containing protein, partial [Spirochaetales bacterium]|nr:PIN domain-containing protein [Spirochaetales bacterium]
MILWDVNLWVYAFRKDSPAHDQSRKVILETLEGSDSFLFCPHVAASFLRLVTNRRILKKPSDIREAWEFIDTLESHPNARYAEVDRMTFGIFKHLVLANLSAGNTIPDVLLAALGVRYNCAFLTADREFPRL